MFDRVNSELKRRLVMKNVDDKNKIALCTHIRSKSAPFFANFTLFNLLSGGLNRASIFFVSFHK